VLAATTSGQSAAVYFAGLNTALSGMTPGVDEFLSTAGTRNETAPSTSGYTSQQLGQAVSATAMQFAPKIAITLA
jgi:hypothetical protein